ncbi:hypothetical protein NQZ68_019153 [Dissostichus eleginoides]|nr:hypothetical protein NQZ68_019153 [Dissostichus eleginoides]
MQRRSARGPTDPSSPSPNPSQMLSSQSEISASPEIAPLPQIAFHICLSAEPLSWAQAIDRDVKRDLWVSGSGTPSLLLTFRQTELYSVKSPLPPQLCDRTQL